MPGGVNSSGTDSKNWLVFGAGSHKCIGQSYVYMHMAAVIGTAAGLLNWEHEITAESEEVKIIGAFSPRQYLTPLPPLGRLLEARAPETDAQSSIAATIFPKDECRLKFTRREVEH